MPIPLADSTQNAAACQLQCGRPLQPNTIPHKKSVDEMAMPDAGWSAPVELVNRILDAIPKLLDEIAHDQEARAIVSIVAVNPD